MYICDSTKHFTGITEEIMEEENDRMISDISSKTRTLKQVSVFVCIIYTNMYRYFTSLCIYQFSCTYMYNRIVTEYYHTLQLAIDIRTETKDQVKLFGDSVSFLNVV